MKKLRISELIPLMLASVSGLLFFNWQDSWIENLQVKAVSMTVFVITFLVLSILYGNTHVKKYGKSFFIWIGVSISGILSIIQLFILLIAVTWFGIF